MGRLLFCRSLDYVGEIVPLAHSASLAGEPAHDLGCAVCQDFVWRMVRAVEPALDGAAAGTRDMAEAFDGFDRVGEPSEVAKRNGLWVSFFGPASWPDAI